MATNKVWKICYVPGNPAMFSRVVEDAANPYMKSRALAVAKFIADNGGGWRVWVEHSITGKRIFESKAEIHHQAAMADQ
jgi:hypothetical protein